MGRDDYVTRKEFDELISIHAPRVGRDIPASMPFAPPSIFQSTRPVWGATFSYYERTDYMSISIHAPRVGRDKVVTGCNSTVDISIHAPRVGRDRK